nr:Chain B, DNA repair protein RAD4 [Saccharomyces cerevisiae S288C]
GSTDDSVEEIQSSEEDYDSEEFEDVTDGNEVAGVEDISVEIK